MNHRKLCIFFFPFSFYLDVIDTYGHDIAIQRSIEMAIKVFTDAETDTPCMYDTVLHMNDPNIHSETLTLFWIIK